MPNYVNNPDNHGEFISSTELQKLNPYKVMPPVLISDWMKRDLWSRREAVQLLAGCLPSQSGLDITAPRNYLDKTNDHHLFYGDAPPKGWPDNIDPFGDYPRLKHPLREDLTQNLCTLIGWVEHCDLNETKPPREWIDWADIKGFKPYWLEYAATIQSAPAAKVEAGKAKSPGGDGTISTANLVYWRLILNENIKKIDANKKGSVRDVIKYLRNLGEARLPNKGKPDELFWIDDYGTEKPVNKKTISNAISDARKLP